MDQTPLNHYPAGANLKLINQFIKNPSNSLQIKSDLSTQQLFHYAFMHGFSGVMFFTIISSIAIFKCSWMELA